MDRLWIEMPNEASEFWTAQLEPITRDRVAVGKGSSREEAIADLAIKLGQAGDVLRARLAAAHAA
jgi:hypothetical protein